MNITIRALKTEDIKDLYSIRSMNGVRENINGLISYRFDKLKEKIDNLSENEHWIVAETQENGKKRVVGFSSLKIKNMTRDRHCASVSILVDKKYQGKGIGKTLFENIIDLADNWLMLIRLELDVFADNEIAINLYKKYGFVIEGTKKYAAIKNGRYEDICLMARYNKKILSNREDIC